MMERGRVGVGRFLLVVSKLVLHVNNLLVGVRQVLCDLALAARAIHRKVQ